MQKAVLHRKEATAEELRFFRLWLVVALHINNWSSGPILIPVERQVHRKKQKICQKKMTGKHSVVIMGCSRRLSDMKKKITPVVLVVVLIFLDLCGDSFYIC